MKKKIVLLYKNHELSDLMIKICDFENSTLYLLKINVTQVDACLLFTIIEKNFLNYQKKNKKYF